VSADPAVRPSGELGLELHSARGRWVVAATVLGSSIVLIDGTVVNVALPAIGHTFHTGLQTLQWTVTAYTLTLAAFILVGGSIGDHYGRRRSFVVGVLWFAAASLLCGIAPSAGVLIAARALQGVGAALLMPESLAIIQAVFRPADRAPAIGVWSGLGGISAAIGPFIGGYLIQTVSWRLIFLINLPLVAAVVWIAERHVPETRDPSATGRLDLAGAGLATVALGTLIYGLISGPDSGWTTATLAALAVAVVAAAVFVARERATRHPMLPLDIFRARQFTSANVVTFAVYGALGGALFLLPIQLQLSLGYSPLEAGTALLPITLVMLALSARAGRLSQRIGPRLPMTLGPIVAGGGLALLSFVQPGTSYLTTFLPAITVFALGLALTVSPLTATVLAAAPVAHAGLASAVNNAVARAAGLIAVAVLPAAAGLTTASFARPAAFSSGFRTATILAGGVCALGGVISALTIRNEPVTPEEAQESSHYSCPVDGPPMCVPEAESAAGTGGRGNGGVADGRSAA
jgi:EmrB/QacA subfamily drug resistance transporter